MASAISLPIDHILPQLRDALGHRDAVVLQAPPGAGKTTRAPLALLDEPWLQGRSIVMLEPRRVAAVNVARFMARHFGEEVGQTVGYAIRFDHRLSKATRIEVVTEGILTRRLQSDPTLEDVGLVIFDEFHERSLTSDLALALCRDAQTGLREDLKLLVMSATLDAGPVSELLGDAPLLTSEGRCYSVDIRYLPTEPQGRIEEICTRAVLRALKETQGDVLVFLPGSGEIRRCKGLLEAQEGLPDVLLCPLYGELSFAEQERAILPGSKRKVVLATNLAETSLTIEGVRVVIDSGWARRPRFDAGRGLPGLELARISRASAEQRSGRAGRLGPGVCYRLWTQGVQGTLLPFTPPEIRSADLTPLALELACWGVGDGVGLPWLDAPSPGALAAARDLLRQLGALDEQGRVTACGQEMSRFPSHPRLARLLVEARSAGLAALGCDLAALLEERDPFGLRHKATHHGDSDLIDRLEALEDFRRRGVGFFSAVERSARHWRKRLGAGDGSAFAGVSEVGRLLAAGWPDRIGQQRSEGSGTYLLRDGQGAGLSEASCVQGKPLIVAVDLAAKGKGEGAIRMASVLSPELIEELFADQIETCRRVDWDRALERVVAVQERRLGSLVLETRSIKAQLEEICRALLQGLRGRGLESLAWSREARQLVARARFASRLDDEGDWPDFSEQGLEAGLEDWLGPYISGVRSCADLERCDLLAPLQARLSWPQRQKLDALAPERIEVPSGSNIRLDYDVEGPPVLAVKLQELFGLAETPRVGAGRVPVLLHLLSPAQRPIQVTADLRNFWESVYPEVKKELKGRYPRHPWPDDPWSAAPTRFAQRRKPG